ncbi:hypothetical protein [Streptococcus halichoeri]|uniref:hypothetical protein n=1 Tax=Streptococcus halichoeri TaxID=254785 RepID=UPI00135C009A|nr:hypothetical protein [Streptococcus halichoeri]
MGGKDGVRLDDLTILWTRLELGWTRLGSDWASWLVGKYGVKLDNLAILWTRLGSDRASWLPVVDLAACRILDLVWLIRPPGRQAGQTDLI